MATGRIDVQQQEQPHWQCVLVLWGSRYPVSDVNRIVAQIRAGARHQPRFVLITDRDRPGLAAGVEQRFFPDYFLQHPFTASGCQAKLAMFEQGVVPDDLPAVYVDLDTLVTGDLMRGIALMRDRRSILMLQSVVLPFGWPGRLVHRLTGGHRYARGNSSVVVFHPAECGFIAQRFHEVWAAHPDMSFRPTIADERFISWVAQDRMIALPRSFAAKLSAEFMLPFSWLIALRTRLPWVRRRRAGLAAVTLSGPEVKAHELLSLPEGAMITDRKGRALIWSDRAMGPFRQQLIDAYAHDG
ncbi:MAG: hypothetical protein DI533_11970 [Cereibacter sphaeroides]|uniref:Glycosyltransferase n=1 Tax=Cereibacter sphaeroides TaxID=1063 RepID=A0A2W5S7R4_CERSP|nr:MAG: hypothetical protein DI533_11970 [Cereibacter sphaeroides]